MMPPAGPVDFFHVAISDPLVSLADAMVHLHLADPARAAEVTRTTRQAQNVILDYLKHGADPAWTEATVPDPVRSAILLMLTHLWEHRGDDPETDEGLWAAIGRLLPRFRDPAVA